MIIIEIINLMMDNIYAINNCIMVLIISSIFHSIDELILTFYVIQAGQPPVTESQLERVIEELEVRCWERIQTIVKNEEGLGIEYDENVICDVCRSVSDLFIFI